MDAKPTPSRKLRRLRRWIDRRRAQLPRIVLGSASGTAWGLLWINTGHVGLGYAAAGVVLAWGAYRCPVPQPEPVTPQSAQPELDFCASAERLGEQGQQREIERLMRQCHEQSEAIERELDIETDPERWGRLQAKCKRWLDLAQSLSQCLTPRQPDPEEQARRHEFFARRAPMQLRRRMLQEAAAIRRGEFMLIPPRQPAPDEVERRRAAAVDALLAVLDGEETEGEVR